VEVSKSRPIAMWSCLKDSCRLPRSGPFVWLLIIRRLLLSVVNMCNNVVREYLYSYPFRIHSTTQHYDTAECYDLLQRAGHSPASPPRGTPINFKNSNAAEYDRHNANNGSYGTIHYEQPLSAFSTTQYLAAYKCLQLPFTHHGGRDLTSLIPSVHLAPYLFQKEGTLSCLCLRIAHQQHK
jgi:hypothetical protein